MLVEGTLQPQGWQAARQPVSAPEAGVHKYSPFHSIQNFLIPLKK
jgi:hypothetical protein